MPSFCVSCGPVALAAYLVVAMQLRGKLRGQRVNLDEMDVIDANAADVRFLQATRHGEVMTPVELVEGHAGPTDRWAPRVIGRMRGGESLGLALIREDVPLENAPRAPGALRH